LIFLETIKKKFDEDFDIKKYYIYLKASPQTCNNRAKYSRKRKEEKNLDIFFSQLLNEEYEKYMRSIKDKEYTAVNNE